MTDPSDPSDDPFTRHCSDWAAIRARGSGTRQIHLQHDLEERVARHLALAESDGLPIREAMVDVTMSLAAAAFRACILCQPDLPSAQARYVELLSDMAECLQHIGLRRPSRHGPDSR